MKIILVPTDEETELEIPLGQDYGIRGFPEEKREFIMQMIQWLKE